MAWYNAWTSEGWMGPCLSLMVFDRQSANETLV